MFDQVPTVRARHLGASLQRVMEDAGLNASQMAEKLGWSASKVSRLLSGKRGSAPAQIAAFLALCGIKTPQWNTYLALAEDPDNPVWWQDYGATVPSRVPPRDDLEATASTIVCYATMLVPDLLRTTEYTRTVLQAGNNTTDGEIDERVAETMRRQKLLDHSAHPELVVYLDEHVLTRTGAGNSIMSDQAHHLLRMALWPDIHVRVVPDGRHTAMAQPFTLYQFPALAPVVFLEFPTSVAYLEKPNTLATYQKVVSVLDAAALDRTGTREWLAEIGRRRSPHHPVAGEKIAEGW